MKNSLFIERKSRVCGLVRSALLLLTIAGMMLGNASAGNRYWTGEAWNANWSEPGNWSPEGVPQPADTLIFGNLGSQKNNNNDIPNIRVFSILFNGSSGGYSLNGQPILVEGDVTAMHTSGYNTVRAGVQFVNGGGSINSGAAGRLEVAGNVTLANNQSLIVFTFGTNITISGAIVGQGSLIKIGTFDLFLTGSGANTYSGGTTIQGGKLYLSKSSGAQAISSPVYVGYDAQMDSALVELKSGQYPPAMSMYIGDRGTWFTTNGATLTQLVLDNAYIYGEGLLNLQCNVTNYGFSHIFPSLYLGNETRVFHTDHGDWITSELQLHGSILGPSGGENPPGIIKRGYGMVQLLNQNTYSGLTVVERGTLSARHPQALGTTTHGTRVELYAMLEIGRTIDTNLMTVGESIVLDGGVLEGWTEVLLTGSVTLERDSSMAGSFSSNRLFNISGVVSGPGGFTMHGGRLRLSGPTANTFAGDVLVKPGGVYPNAILEMGKPDDIAAIPTKVVVKSFSIYPGFLRNVQNNGVRHVTLMEGGIWDLNGYMSAPTPLIFDGFGTVDTGFKGGVPGALAFAGLTVNTQLQVRARPALPSNYVATIRGRVLSFAATNDLFIPPGVTLEFRGEMAAPALQKRGAGKLLLGSDNRLVEKIFVHDGEVITEDDRALGAHTTVFDGATVWLNTIFNFGNLTLRGTGFQGTNGALATTTFAIFSSNVVLAANTTINSVSVDGRLHIQGVISGNGSIRKNGTGTAVFEGSSANVFNGDVFVDAGLLILAKNPFIPAVPRDIFIGSGLPNKPGATVLYAAPDQVWNRITINRQSLLDLNGHDEYSGDLTLNDGGDVRTGAGTLYLGSGVNLVVNPSNGSDGSVISGKLALGAGSHSLRVHNSQDPFPDLQISASIRQMADTAHIIKVGAGELALSGTNTFAGTFTIDEGKLTIENGMALGTKEVGTFLNNNAVLMLNNAAWVSDEPLMFNSTNPAAFTSFTKTNAWGGPITLLQTANIYVPGGGLVLSSFADCCEGVISGPGGINKTGPGALSIVGYRGNTYTGLTTIRDGQVDLWRILGPAIPGDVIITGTNASLLSGYSPSPTSLSSNASVTVKDGALWRLRWGNIETVRSVSGNGRIQLDQESSLTVNNTTNVCEVSGPISGPGALNKRGPGTFVLSGQSPLYGGTATVYQGTLKVDGRISGMPVIVKAGAQLRGDGIVQNVTATEQDSVIDVEASFLEEADRQGGDLEVSYLTLAPGAGVSATLFGSSPTAGNDMLIAHGPVTLGDAKLSTSFKYPPRDGDRVTLFDKRSFGPFVGAFNGWPEGIVRKVGDVTVRATYLGGDGNDFVLTVTNVALDFTKYRLAEGNGNQTVEPDECNLLFVSLTNRRATPITITNAVVRSLTRGAAVTVASARYPAIPGAATRENITPFQFRTDTSLLCGQPVQFEVIFGILGEGEFAAGFEVIAGEGPDCTRPTGGCESCLVVRGQFTTNAPALTRPHNFIGAPSICFPPKRCPETNAFSELKAVPYLTHSFTNSTTNEVCVTAQLRFSCVGVSNALGAVAYLGTNDYHDPCVNYLGDTGVDGTQAFQFRVPAGSNFIVLVSARATNVVCPEYTLELFGLPCPNPTLGITKDTPPDRVRVHWTTATPGWNLQHKTRIPDAFANWPETPAIIGGRYVVTNRLGMTNEFYRLAK